MPTGPGPPEKARRGGKDTAGLLSCPGPTDPLATQGPRSSGHFGHREKLRGQRRPGRVIKGSGWVGERGPVWICQAWVQPGRLWGAGVGRGCRNSSSHREQRCGRDRQGKKQCEPGPRGHPGKRADIYNLWVTSCALRPGPLRGSCAHLPDFKTEAASSKRQPVGIWGPGGEDPLTREVQGRETGSRHCTARGRTLQWPSRGATYIFGCVICLPLSVGGGGRGERSR